MNIGDEYYDLDDPEQLHSAMHESLQQCCLWIVMLVLVILGALLLVLHPWVHR